MNLAVCNTNTSHHTTHDLKHFLKAENSEDSLASLCEEFCISFHIPWTGRVATVRVRDTVGSIKTAP